MSVIDDLQTIYKDGEPVAVIVPIEAYREMLERLEDIEDARELEEMRKRPLKFHSLEEILEEFDVQV